MTQRARIFLISAALVAVYACLLLYVSLLPFHFRELSTDQVFAAYRRAGEGLHSVSFGGDAVLNALLFAPLGLFFGAMKRSMSGAAKLLAWILFPVLLFGFAFALETAQMFFPPRNFFLTDLLAQCLGMLLGFVSAGPVVGLLAGTRRGARGGSGSAWRTLFGLYLCLIVLLSLYPFDLALSLRALEARFASDRVGWLVASGGCQSLLRCTFKYGSVGLMFVPVGWYFAAAAGVRKNAVRAAVSFSLVLAALLELTQLLLSSAYVEGMPVVCAAAGAGIGAWSARYLRQPDMPRFARVPVPWLLLLAVGYALVFCYVRVFVAAGNAPGAGSAQSMGWKALLPLYRYYYATHSGATMLVNGAALALLGAPAGVLTYLASVRARAGRQWMLAGCSAGILVFFLGIEIARHAMGRQVDTVEWLISLAGAFAGYVVAKLALGAAVPAAVDRRARRGETHASATRAERSRNAPTLKKKPAFEKKWLILAATAVVAGLAALKLDLTNPYQLMRDGAVQSNDLSTISPNQWIRYHQPFYSGWRRQAHAGIAYDSQRATFYVFGSDTHGKNWDNSVHEFDPDSKSWETHYPAADPSTYRVDEQGVPVSGEERVLPWAMHTFDNVLYDPVTDALVVTSRTDHTPKPEGVTGTASVQPTWFYSLALRAWLTPENMQQSFPSNFAGSSAYDTGRDVVVSYGNRLAEFGPERREWRTVNVNKVHRIHHSMEYDSVNRTLVVFGDYSNSNSIWVYTPGPLAGEPGTWERREPGGDYCPPDQHFPVAYDPDDEVFLLTPDNRFKKGSKKERRAGAATSSTYVYDPQRNIYRKLPLGDMPALGMNYMMVYDLRRKVFFLVTGDSNEAPTVWVLRLSLAEL